MKVIILSSLIFLCSNLAHSKVSPQNLLGHFQNLIYKGLFSEDFLVHVKAEKISVLSEKLNTYPVIGNETFEFIQSFEIAPIAVKLRNKSLRVSCIWIKGHFSYQNESEYIILDRVILPLDNQDCTGPLQVKRGLNEETWPNRLEIKNYNMKRDSASDIIIYYFGNTYALIRAPSYNSSSYQVSRELLQNI